jgi:hypothetical protein
VLFASDPDKKISFETFQTMVLPESIVLDKQQNMRRKFAGGVNWGNKAITSLLQSYLH